MRQRIAALGARPEFWLYFLLLWIVISAGRSAGGPWARVALTEALRWAVGLGLTLALRRGLPPLGSAARLLTGIAAAISLSCLARGDAFSQGVTGPYSDHQLCASALLVLLPVTLAVGLTARLPAWRWGAQIIAAAALACLLLTQTRSAWAGVILLGLAFLALWLYRSGQRTQNRRLFLVPLLAIIGVLAAFWTFTGTAGLRAPLAARAGTVEALNHDESWQWRLRTWRGAIRMAALHPLTGWGVGRYPEIQQRWTQEGRALLPSQRPSLSEQAHDFYLQTAVEQGLGGLALYFAALAAFAVHALRALRQSRGTPIGERDGLLIAALAMLVGQGIDAIASPSWQFPEVSLLFWAALGVGLAALRAHPELEPAHRPLSRPLRFASVGLAAVFLLAQFLPLGLLSPVEAYNHSNTVTYVSAQVQQTTTNCPASSLCFSLSATYSDNRTQDVTFDSGSNINGNAGTPSYFTCLQVNGSSPCNGSFGTGSSRNVLALNNNDKGKSLKIIGHFQDNTDTNKVQTGTSAKSASLILTE